MQPGHPAPPRLIPLRLEEDAFPAAKPVTFGHAIRQGDSFPIAQSRTGLDWDIHHPKRDAFIRMYQFQVQKQKIDE